MQRKRSRDTMPVPLAVRAAQGLLLVQSAFWIVLSALHVLRLLSGAASGAAWIAAVLMFGFACVLAGAAAALGTQRRLFFAAAIILAVLTTILSVTDEFGVLDLISLLLNLALLGLLLLTRKHYRLS
jgi:hypothetical protein